MMEMEVCSSRNSHSNFMAVTIIGVQQLLMSLELMRAGYPPFVRREMASYYHYLQKEIQTHDMNSSCDVLLLLPYSIFQWF